MELLRRGFVHLLVVFAAIVSLYPVLWVLDLAFSTGQSTTEGWLPWPTNPSLEHFRKVLLSPQGLFWRQFANSLVVATATSLLGISISTTAAYALSRWAFRGRNETLQLFLITQMFPGVLMSIPLYLILDTLQLLDSRTGLVLVYATTSIPFSVWNLKGYFDTIPRELEEAAMLDGANRWTTFWRIILPLARPALAVTGLFSFLTAWNEFALAATVLSDPRMFTLPVMLQRFIDDHHADWGAFAAGSILVSLPVLILFFALQRHFVEGLTAGSVKG